MSVSFAQTDGGASFAQTDAGAWGAPFGQRSLYVLHVPLLDFHPADPEAPPPGRIAWSLESGYANTFSRSWHPVLYHQGLGPPGTPFRKDEAEKIHTDFPNERAWFIDGDILRSSLTARVGVTATTFVSVEIPYVAHQAFSGDGVVGDFHRIFGISPAGRADFPEGQFVVMTQPAFGPLGFTSDSPASGPGDVVASFGWRPPATGRGRSYGLDVAIKAPTGRARDFNGSGGWDAGALFFVAQAWQKWRVQVEGGVIVPGEWKVPVPLSTAPFGRLLIGVTRRFGSKTRVGASVTVEQSPFRREDLDSVSTTGAEFALGVDRDFSRFTVRLLMTENLPSVGDRADAGLTLSLSYRP